MSGRFLQRGNAARPRCNRRPEGRLKPLWLRDAPKTNAHAPLPFLFESCPVHENDAGYLYGVALVVVSAETPFPLRWGRSVSLHDSGWCVLTQSLPQDLVNATHLEINCCGCEGCYEQDDARSDIARKRKEMCFGGKIERTRCDGRSKNPQSDDNFLAGPSQLTELPDSFDFNRGHRLPPQGMMAYSYRNVNCHKECSKIVHSCAQRFFILL